MAANGPLSPSTGVKRAELTLPMPPPLLHTRSGNELYEMPTTPTTAGFTSPYHTPQGSPSKKQLPPGANDLPNVFDNSMKLTPTSPMKTGRQQLSLHSPNKGGRQALDETIDDSVVHQDCLPGPGSPLRKSNKENTPPGIRLGKPGTPNQAAVSRQEPYQSRDETVGKVRYNPQRGLTPEELEKLQLPKVKRLANVTQLCKTPKTHS